MIGAHFPQVSDKLTNILQLKDSGADSDLIIASIEQKAKEIQPVPFQLAINFKSNVKYARYLAIPVLILLVIWVSGKLSLFNESYQRVVDYKTAYTPPAPFRFVVMNSNLEAEEGKDFQLKVFTEGDVMPEEAQIIYEGQSYFLRKNKAGQFEYEFENIKKPLQFQLKANEVNSPNYQINLIEVPKIIDLSLDLQFPKYTQFESKKIKGTGNAKIPEGTLVEWKLSTANTKAVALQMKDSTYQLKQVGDNFQLQQNVKKSLNYQLSTSNEARKNYESLNFKLDVIKDEYPDLDIASKKDSVQQKTTYFQGKASDDYGLTKLQLVYYPSQNPKEKQVENISISSSNYAEFLYVFPNQNLNLKEGETYTYYFEVFDNDGVNGSKKTKSKYFNFRKNTEQEAKKEKLNQQSESIKGMQKALDEQKKDAKDLDEIEQMQKEKNKLSFSDKKKIENYLKRQEQQRQMMKDYSKELKENLEKFEPESKDAKKEDLIERLEENEERLEQNEELMEELDKYRDKLEDEKLNEKLKQAANENKKQERTLEQLLELTKRYYIERKTQQLAEELNELAKKQEELSEEENATTEEQDKLNDEFDKLKEDSEELEKENQNLKKPMELFRDEYTEEEIKEDMKDASEMLDKKKEEEKKEGESSEGSEESEGEEESENSEQEEGDEKEKGEDSKGSDSNSSPQQKQKDASEKMKELSKKMGASMMAGGEAQQAEDAETLKRILQNLIRFSFEQENLIEAFDRDNNADASFAKNLRKQADLRENFKHIDDSLFSLALRNEMITEKITSKITDIQYNTELSLERLADNKINLAQSNQQYVMTNANDLANMLDGALDNMQQQMSGGGGSGSSGEGESGDNPGEQLSDIIKSHEELEKEMQNAMGKSPGKGKEGESQGDSPGEDGKEGGESQGGQNERGEGQSGQDGEQGQDGANGNNSQEGENGKQQGEGESSNEQMNGELYEIYKKQQALKQQLEDRIKELGIESDAGNLKKSIEQMEEELLMKGFSSDVLKQMKNINHQLLKLKEAAQKQGEEEKREATTNTKEFENQGETELDRAKEYFNTIEILNRQQLPLQPKYKNLIKQYFNEQKN
ncbi:ATPase [Psychroflexus planctonicus]|uniref:ATPase n=2 Tax=Psychroflexus planctonicus TaxID=1526575 RepID=A0ABQ1SKN1_9FLAO|nr:ATPase [Psychroflexus planctonicus]